LKQADMIEKEHKPISIDEHQHHDLNHESGIEDEDEDDDFDFDDNDSKGSFAFLRNPKVLFCFFGILV
jgi:hypothetical protein